MRKFFPVVFFALATLTAGAQRKTFSSPDGTFTFTYPATFSLCTGAALEQCRAYSYIPVCDEDALVCVIYPPDEFKGTNFGAGGLEVKIVTGRIAPPPTADECITPAPVSEAQTEFLLSAEYPSEMIGGVLFVHGTSVGAAMNHRSSTDVYRAFHGGKCYELDVTTTATSYEVYEPGTIRKFTMADEKKVMDALNKVLHSFRFTK